MPRPKLNKELQKVAEQFDEFTEETKKLTHDEMRKAPILETEAQTKLSNRELNKMDGIYVEPIKSINSKEPFNEKFRKAHTEAWERILCIAENNEIMGEAIEKWTKEFPGDPAHFWRIPVNKPVYLPRFVAKQLANCKYHRLVMEDQPAAPQGGMQFYGTMQVKHTKHRLDARPVASGFTSMSS